jgi:hypothetical protein
MRRYDLYGKELDAHIPDMEWHWARRDEAQAEIAKWQKSSIDALATAKQLRDDLTAATLQRDILQRGLKEVSGILRELSKELT